MNNDAPARNSSTAALALLALGVVFGDIGTSPLYAVKETFNAEHGITPVGVSKQIRDIIDGVYVAGDSREALKAAEERAVYEAMGQKGPQATNVRAV